MLSSGGCHIFYIVSRNCLDKLSKQTLATAKINSSFENLRSEGRCPAQALKLAVV